jgi:hypothetical protein
LQGSGCRNQRFCGVTCWLPFCVISSVVRVVEKRGVEVLECEKNCSKNDVLIFISKD